MWFAGESFYFTQRVSVSNRDENAVQNISSFCASFGQVQSQYLETIKQGFLRSTRHKCSRISHWTVHNLRLIQCL
jgi:hypothetical protein